MKKLYILAFVLAVVFVLEMVFGVFLFKEFSRPVSPLSENAPKSPANVNPLKLPADKTNEEASTSESSEQLKVPDEDGLVLHDKKWEDRLDKHVSIIEQENDVSVYVITGKSGLVLYSEAIYWRTAVIEQVDTNVFMFIFQAGTGPGTISAVFCDVENERVSDRFEYVLFAQGEYVFCGGHEYGDHAITVQKMFDPQQSKRIELNDCSPVAYDVVTDIKIIGKGRAAVTYLTGKDCRETTVEVTFL